MPGHSVSCNLNTDDVSLQRTPCRCFWTVGSHACLIAVAYVWPLCRKCSAAIAKEGWDSSQNAFVLSRLRRLSGCSCPLMLHVSRSAFCLPYHCLWPTCERQVPVPLCEGLLLHASGPRRVCVSVTRPPRHNAKCYICPC